MGRVAAVVLAAGSSSRMGRPKQLLEVGDAPMLQHAVDAAASADVDEVIVVLGHEAAAVEEALRLPGGALVVRNRDHAEGLSTSLATGLRALGREHAAAVVILGDQPEIEASSIRAVVGAYRETGARVVQASYRGTADHPVLLDRRAWPEVLAVTGDRGAREVIASHPEWVHRVELDRDPPRDVDTPADYEDLRH
ncbi:MAG TPA: nucleotidyltransferase family protein [Actinomycetota bacterium]